MVSEHWIGKDAAGSGYSLIDGSSIHLPEETENTKENLDHDLNLRTAKYAAGVVAIQQHIYKKTHKYYIIPL